MSLSMKPQRRALTLPSRSIFTNNRSTVTLADNGAGRPITANQDPQSEDLNFADILLQGPECEQGSLPDSTEPRLLRLLTSLKKPSKLESQTFYLTSGKTKTSQEGDVAQVDEAQPPLLQSIPPLSLIHAVAPGNINPAQHHDLEDHVPDLGAANNGPYRTTHVEEGASGIHENVQHITTQQIRKPELASPTGSRWGDSEDDEDIVSLVKDPKAVGLLEAEAQREYSSNREGFSSVGPF
ncbi:hypothetical protein SISSUDRAFT_1060491 [Sistotremastrum suecicum HHB10207 ss-3]|uniref:Uncharacterized protein n=1 Tax=Sistotremastrum suecicum HHB10207 ss-3 TaxID=1314776 RepID=A0A166F4Y4_9AGAM|nr:hypothetical protein SISSUDRAFT_1060491 [Sistotremastrum suecicum HHB10207 ss-3]